jgi:hypothetical protein
MFSGSIRKPDPEETGDDSKVDITKRYYVYSVENGVGSVVYRNVLFRRARTLLGSGIPRLDFVSHVIELEQSNSQSVFVGHHHIVATPGKLWQGTCVPQFNQRDAATRPGRLDSER